MEVGREGEVKWVCTVIVIEKEGSPVIAAALAHASGQADSHFETHWSQVDGMKVVTHTYEGFFWS